MKFLAELKRRNVIRMAGLYLVGAWLIVQVAGTILPMFGAPDWVARTVVILLAIGFIPALVISWVFELTPEGLKREDEIEPGASIKPDTARRMDRMLIGVLVVALGYFAVDKFVLAPGQQVASPTSVVPAAGAAERKAGAPNSAALASAQADAKSIAVLAFANMSSDKDNEYFSDGVAEEILNALADIDALKVAGRTSSFYFKDRNESLATIGSTLGVAHVLEGSVRKQGERLRISAKLLRVSDGVELWADTFDGTDADIFALQERIAQQVTSELKVALNVGQRSRLVDSGTANPEAYALYLQATDIFNRRDRKRFLDAIAALQEAVERDPNYARAYARLASMHVVLASYTDADLDQTQTQVMRYATEALALDADSAEAWAARGASLRKSPRMQVPERCQREFMVWADSADHRLSSAGRGAD
jgi:TolB-like protein